MLFILYPSTGTDKFGILFLASCTSSKLGLQLHNLQHKPLKMSIR